MVPRVVLGAQLRRLRDARRISREQAGEAIGASESKISRLELGRTGCKPFEVAGLLTFYGVTDQTDRATLLTLAAQANSPGWWHPYNDVITDWLEGFIGLEQAAGLIRTYGVQLIPDLLQTEAYAHAVIMFGHPNAPEDEIERRVELRMKRQRMLHQPEAPRLWAVIDEAALRRPVGGPATMRAQIEHLVDICELPNVTVQVLPFYVGGHAAMRGPITLLRLPEHELPDVVYLEQFTSAHHLDRLADIKRCWDAMNRLVTVAEPPISTPAILDRITKES